MKRLLSIALISQIFSAYAMNPDENYYFEMQNWLLKKEAQRNPSANQKKEDKQSVSKKEKGEKNEKSQGRANFKALP